jgi:hypothetical protein
LVSGVDCRRFRRDKTNDSLAGDAAEAFGKTRVARLETVGRRGRQPPSLAREHGWRVGLTMVAKDGKALAAGSGRHRRLAPCRSPSDT